MRSSCGVTVEGSVSAVPLRGVNDFNYESDKMNIPQVWILFDEESFFIVSYFISRYKYCPYLWAMMSGWRIYFIIHWKVKKRKDGLYFA